MTHWQRILFYPWFSITCFLLFIWMISLQNERNFSVTFRRTYVNFSTTPGAFAIKHTVFPPSTPPQHWRIGPVKSSPSDFSRPDQSLFGRFNWSRSTNSSGKSTTRIAAPIWLLILLHTTFFLLLYYLAHRHYRKKTTSLPSP